MGEAARRARAAAPNAHDRVSWRQGERRMGRSAAAELARIATDGAKLFADAPTDKTRQATPDEMADLALMRDEIVRSVLETDLPDDAILTTALDRAKELVHPQVLQAFIRKLRVVRASREQAQGDLVAQGIVADKHEAEALTVRATRAEAERDALVLGTGIYRETKQGPA